MTDLPPGWEATTTDALLDFVTSGSRGWARHYSHDGALFIRVGNLRRGSIAPDLADVQRVSPPEGAEGSRTRVASNDILISITADLGRIALMADVREPTYINQHVALARPGPPVRPRYLAWYLTSEAVQRQWARQQRGVTKLGLGLQDIRSIDTPLPPLAEQERIVAAIEKQFSRIDAGMAALERVQRNLRRMRAALLQAAVTGRLVPQRDGEGSGRDLLDQILTKRSRKKAPAAASSHVMALPESWAVASLEALTDSERPICYGILMPRVKEAGVVPYVEVKDLRAKRLSVANLHRTSQELHQAFPRSILAPGDVVLAIRGSFDRALVVPDEVAGSNVSRDVARIAPMDGLDPDFLVAYLASPPSLQYLRQRARGVAVKGVNIADLRSMPIPLPPIAEQRRISKELQRRSSIMDNLLRAVEEAHARSGRLRSSTLAAAFSGKLVAQDFNDEPASVLLERIAATRAASNGQAKTAVRKSRTANSRVINE
jgi:type I restriction enzyme S subunit